MIEKKQTDTRVKSIRGFYMAVFKKMFGFTPQMNYMLSGVLIKRWLKDFNEWQLDTLILIHFNWHGMDSNDEWVYKRLKDNAFPLGWMNNNLNSYQAYARNVLGLDFDNEKALQEYVSKHIKTI